jgi:hypothetical protein
LHLHRPSVILHRNLQHERIIHINVNHQNIAFNLPKLVSLIIRNLKEHQDDFLIRHVGQNNSCLKSNTHSTFLVGGRLVAITCERTRLANSIDLLTVSGSLFGDTITHLQHMLVCVLYWRDSVLEATAFIFIIICWIRGLLLATSIQRAAKKMRILCMCKNDV